MNNETFIINNKTYSLKKNLGTVTFKEHKLLISDDMFLIDINTNLVYNNVYNFIQNCDNNLYQTMMIQINKLNSQNSQNSQYIYPVLANYNLGYMQPMLINQNLEYMQPIYVNQNLQYTPVNFSYVFNKIN